MTTLSQQTISSYVGDVVPLFLRGDGVDQHTDVAWTCEGDAVTLRRFDSADEFAFRNGVLLSLIKEGTATVIATCNGQEYRATIHTRPMKQASDEDVLHYYLADTHCHTSRIHNRQDFAKHENEDIGDCVDFVKNEGLLDMSVISDHACVTNDYDFFKGFCLAQECHNPLILAGTESEITYTEQDRIGVMERHSGELVTLMTAGYIHAQTYEEYENEILRSPAPVGIFAHPHVVGISTPGIWNFDFAKHNTPNMRKIMRGVEMGNGGDNKENLLHEYAYSQALDAGFRVSVTCSSDSHGPTWGYHCVVGKTVILATEKSREAFHDALLHNRFYATESGNVKLAFSVNGSTAPADLALTDTYVFHIELDYFKEDPTTIPVTCQVLSDYGEVVYETAVNTGVLDFTLKSETARYFFLRLYDSEGRKTWSMPVWCSRAFDKPQSPCITPLDMSTFTATTAKKDAAVAINGDLYDTFFSEERLPTVVIDMKQEHTICALGYRPHIVVRKGKPFGWTTSDESKGLVARFRVLVSADGKQYQEVACKTCQTLGSETIVTFQAVSARYVKFEVLGNIGTDSRRPNYADSQTVIGNLTVFQ